MLPMLVAEVPAGQPGAWLTACADSVGETGSDTPQPIHYDYTVIARYPHDREAFTEGLTLYRGRLFESVGLWGRSGIREVDLRTGTLIQRVPLSRYYFGEGLAVFDGSLIQLTWKAGEAFVYRPDPLQRIGSKRYQGEGWGITVIGKQLAVSNGSAQLQFLDPDTFEVIRKVTVKQGRQEIQGLNELEFADGTVFANVWPGDCVVEIDPDTGGVLGWLNLSDLLPERKALSDDAVMNGLAYDADKKTWLITGKYWPYLYEIVLQRK